MKVAALFLAFVQAASDPSDWSRCTLRTETRLFMVEDELIPVAHHSTFVFERASGELELATAFFLKNGYFSAVARPGDPYLYFSPDIDGGLGHGRGDRAAGVKLSCQAQSLFGIRFKRISIQSADGELASVIVN